MSKNGIYAFKNVVYVLFNDGYVLKTRRYDSALSSHFSFQPRIIVSKMHSNEAILFFL